QDVHRACALPENDSGCAPTARLSAESSDIYSRSTPPSNFEIGSREADIDRSIKYGNRPLGSGRHLTALAQPVHRLMLTEAAQFEMADLKDRRRNFHGESISHEKRLADILAEQFQPAEDVDVAPHGGEVETIARANIAVCGIAIVESDIDGNMLLDLRR